ncbi:Cytochrome P450-like protein [Anopheles sinensis]|uniref:Cytochrome P450-like protein n=1 Tax=Anopheles sinensis TaxID=74873 RepID=A0A084W747_ANOSI|nr:Cytochrome P450-like protein [Anopheles sinensis]
MENKGRKQARKKAPTTPCEIGRSRAKREGEGSFGAMKNYSRTRHIGTKSANETSGATQIAEATSSDGFRTQSNRIGFDRARN